jgi:hypothetical protein
MRDNQSPEEKLLRLIRKDKGSSSAADAPKPELSGTAKILAPRQAFSLNFNASFVIKSLFFISCLYLIYCYLDPLLFPKEQKGFKSAIVVEEEKVEPLPTLKPYDSYHQGVQGQELFAALTSTEVMVAPAKDVNLDLIKDLSLVGVLSGENPEAIIQNKKDQKTFYVAKNGFFGEFQVEDIQEGKVILGYHGQKYELFL